jgi:methyl-accepting chemotaxis protein
MEEFIDQRTFVRNAFDKIYEKAEKIADIVLVSYFILGLGLAGVYNTWMLAILSGGFLLAIYYIVKFNMPRKKVHHYLFSAALGFFTVQYIFQLHGMVETRLVIFVGGAVLMYFQQWRLMIPLGVILAIHHNLFAYFEYTGNHDFFYSESSEFSLSGFLLMFSLTTLVLSLLAKFSHDNARRTKSEALNEYKLYEQLKNVKSNVAFAQQLSTGNLDLTYKLKENDDLGESLVSLRDSLKLSKEREEEEKFFNVGLAKASEIMRVQGTDIKELSNQILIFIVKYVKANQGALFVVEEDSNEKKFLEMTACYAYERKKFLSRKIEAGEGLAGQAYLEKDVIYLKDVPSKYINIKSGLGDANPRNVLIVPLMLNEKVFGVIELASFQLFEKYKIEFIKKLGETIASTLSTNKINQKTQQLLQESNELTERMRAQEEEMRQNMEELQASQEEMMRAQKELERRGMDA